jgi:hypothetical protein
MWKKIRELFIAEAPVSDDRQNVMAREFLLREAADRQAARDAKRAKPKKRKRALPSVFDDKVASEIKQQLTAYNAD